MKTITLTLRDHGPRRIDLSRVRLEEIAKQSDAEVGKHTLSTSSGDIELGELFGVASRCSNDRKPTLVMQGDCRHVDALGHQHRSGCILVEGDIGDYCGSCMSDGTIRVRGSAGNHLGGASGSRGVGMNGGEISVSGDAGDFAGYRMRRGEIRIAGNAGNALAAWQVAGTICVGGATGNNAAYGMRRGTLVLATPVPLPVIRFTTPVRLDTPFQTLLMSRRESRGVDFLEAAAKSGEVWTVSRGDRSIGGIGEVWMRQSNA